MLDMSAAFDVVDHQLLLKKLRLYGFDQRSLVWMTSYLSGRTQSVCIDGTLSDPLGVTAGGSTWKHSWSSLLHYLFQ